MDKLIGGVVEDLIGIVQEENKMDTDNLDFGYGVIQGFIAAYTKVIQSAGYEIEFHHRENKCTSITVGAVAFPV